MITALPPDNTSEWHNYALSLPLAVIYITERNQELRSVELVGGHYGRIKITLGYSEWIPQNRNGKELRECKK